MGEIENVVEDLVDRLKHHHQLKFMTPSHLTGEPYQMVPLDLLVEAEEALLLLNSENRSVLADYRRIYKRAEAAERRLGELLASNPPE